MSTSIAVVNCSGNVGKTMITRELLAPRLPHMTVRQIESINSDEAAAGASGATNIMIAAEFDALHEELATGEPLIVDIGASNVEEYLRRLEDAPGAHEDYLCFVVPVVPVRKQVQDSIETIDMLAEMGVEPERIRLLFNQVETLLKEPVEAAVKRQFAPLIAMHEAGGRFTLSLSAAVPKSDAFPIAAGLGLRLDTIHHDSTDYKAAAASLTDPEEKLLQVRRLGLKRKATALVPKLDAAYRALMGDLAP